MKVPASCDIFCTVIDNYGDIGVCWRLSRQLASEYGIAVRLWVDNLAALQRIWPEADAAQSSQQVAGVVVRQWTAAGASGVPWSSVAPAALVIEAFGCQLPLLYIEAMAQRAPQSLWINLEYLSAEEWVGDCHGLASPQPQGHPPKYFFFPGFAANTGGLLRERDLLQQRQAFQREPAAAARLFADWGLADLPAGLLVSLFAYENRALPKLLDAWSRSGQPVVCLVPEGRLLGVIEGFFGGAKSKPRDVRQRGALTVAVLPFLRQDEYDQLLWSCDINFVRGEDSFVRAQWAARPFVWHIYPQPESAHWPKLEAFLDRYRATLEGLGAVYDKSRAPLPADASRALADFWRGWNGGGEEIATAWQALEPWMPALREAAPVWPDEQATRGNLAAALVQFCANNV